MLEDYLLSGERVTFFELTEKYSHVLLGNRSSDNPPTMTKKQAWIEIAKEFKALHPIYERTPEFLRSLYLTWRLMKRREQQVETEQTFEEQLLNRRANFILSNELVGPPPPPSRRNVSEPHIDLNYNELVFTGPSPKSSLFDEPQASSSRTNSSRKRPASSSTDSARPSSPKIRGVNADADSSQQDAASGDPRPAGVLQPIPRVIPGTGLWSRETYASLPIRLQMSLL